MQGHVRDAHLASLVLEAKHQDAVFRIEPRDFRDERRIAVELEARGVDRAFGVRRGYDRLVFSFQRATDRRLGGIERGAAVRRMDFSDFQVGGIELPSFQDLDSLQGQTAASGMNLENPRIPDDHRTADREHPRVERRLERNFRSDAAGIAGGDGNRRLQNL